MHKDLETYLELQLSKADLDKDVRASARRSITDTIVRHFAETATAETIDRLLKPACKLAAAFVALQGSLQNNDKWAVSSDLSATAAEARFLFGQKVQRTPGYKPRQMTYYPPSKVAA